MKITHTSEIIVSIATNVLGRGRIGDTNNKDKGQIYNAKRHTQTERTRVQRTVMAVGWCKGSSTSRGGRVGEKSGRVRGQEPWCKAVPSGSESRWLVLPDFVLSACHSSP